MSVRVLALLVGVFSVFTTVRGEEAKPAPVNPYNGMQQREESFEFTQKPTVQKEGEKWVITFASKANCDATVAILDKDGRIIRHLASGVLGKNAPWPFQQNSLSQRIKWDGKDNAGKPVVAQCSVRVSLGLTPRFDRALGWCPADMSVAGMVVSPVGDLYVIGRRGQDVQVRVFDREGRYLRTLMPHPATVTDKRMTLVNWTRTSWGTAAIHWTREGGGSVWNMHFNQGFTAPAQAPVVTPDGRLAFVTPSLGTRREGIGRLLVLVDMRDGAVPPGSHFRLDQREPGDFGKPGALGNAGRPSLALSPDGKTLYLSGFAIAKEKGDQPVNAVFRVLLNEPGQAQRFLGKPDAPGKDEGSFNEPRGIACDKGGNLYIADWGNDRIQVFRSDGAHLRALPCEKPDQLAVHPKTGAIYVLSIRQTTGSKPQLLKLGGLEDPTVRARLEVEQGRFCLDSTSDPPAIWLGGRGTMLADGRGAQRMIWRLEDRGDKFEKTLDLEQLHRRPEGWWPEWPIAARAYITADPRREELYVRDGNNCFESPILRVDGRTGKLLDTLKPALTVRVGPDGLVYMQLYLYGHVGRWIARYDPDTRKYLSFPENARVCPDGKVPAGWKDAPLGPFFYAGCRRGYQVQPDVAPNGDIYMPAEIRGEHAAEFEKQGITPPKGGFPKIGGGGTYLLHVYTSGGQLKCYNALPGWISGEEPTVGAVRVGPSGAVYCAGAWPPVGVKVPHGVAPDAEYPNRFWGTLLKFNSAFDKFPVGRMIGGWEELPQGAQPTYLGGRRGLRMENIHWEYHGMPCVRSGCNCLGFSFELDRFERVFIPAPQTCSVNVLDANGNLVLRVGGYGNADSLGKDSPVVDAKTGELRPRLPDDPADLKSPLVEPDIGLIMPQYVSVTDQALYINDARNQRIVRAAIAYHAEEIVPVP